MARDPSAMAWSRLVIRGFEGLKIDGILSSCRWLVDRRNAWYGDLRDLGTGRGDYMATHTDDRAKFALTLAPLSSSQTTNWGQRTASL